jgi:hypothetical protein
VVRSTKSISVIICRYSISSAESVVTSMPSTTAVVQAGISLFEPATSTTHSRHWPVADRPRR